MPLTTTLSKVGSWHVVAVAGDLDMASAPALRQAVVAAKFDRPRVVLDLRGVGFIDSTGLGVVVGLLKRVRTADGDLRLVVDEPRVRRVFEITDLTRVFRMFATVEDAVGWSDE